MALSVVDLYSKVLPRTNCRDCGYQTCLAFAGMVVSEKLPLNKCPHIPGEILTWAQAELDAQYREGKWLKKDMAKEALVLAREKAASMNLGDISRRIGGELITRDGQTYVSLPYFNSSVCITLEQITDSAGHELSRNEQTFIYMHMAHGGTKPPSGVMKSLKEFPNTISKVSSMRGHVEAPLQKQFAGSLDPLKAACLAAGGEDVSLTYEDPSAAFSFRAFPLVPVVLLFWDAEDGFEAEAKLLFDQTIVEHLDIESIMFLSEHLASLLLGDNPQ